MESTDPLLETAMEPDSLLVFIGELESAGFDREDERLWRGPTHPALVDGGYTDSAEMGVFITDGWPYQPPLLYVPGLAAWHADREMLCIWEYEDNTQRWKTLLGMNARVVEWTLAEANRFEFEETARNPEIYWTGGSAGYGLVDLDEILGADDADGQHGEFHFVRLDVESEALGVDIFDLHPGGFSPVRPGPKVREDHRQFRGRWFVRDGIDQPPRNLQEFRALLTEPQNRRLDRDLRDRPIVMFGLIWRNGAGLVCTMLLSAHARDDVLVVGLRPKGHGELLLRAGPDASTLATKTVSIVGIGAIGSHVADLLARTGIGELHLYDYDRLWPANLIRHAAPPDTPAGSIKSSVLAKHLGQYPWVTVTAPPDGKAKPIWHPRAIADIAQRSDLVVDATGHSGFSELAARVALDTNTPYVSAALFRGGSVSRVRRQADSTDTPILHRSQLDQYPSIPALDDELEYAGTETGCLARIHNASPVSVVTTASTAATVVIDALCERYDYADEIIDVLRASEDEPFCQVGRIRRTDLATTIDVVESVLQSILDSSNRSAPTETGGILIGTIIGGRKTIAASVEINDHSATDARYRIREDVVPDIVEAARARDGRLGYVGEWHSHPDGGPISITDRATMMAIASASDAPTSLLLLARQTPERWHIEAFEASATTLCPVDIEKCGDIAPPPTEETSDDQAV